MLYMHAWLKTGAAHSGQPITQTICAPRNISPKQHLQVDKVKRKLNCSHFRTQTLLMKQKHCLKQKWRQNSYLVKVIISCFDIKGIIPRGLLPPTVTGTSGTSPAVVVQNRRISVCFWLFP